MCAPIIPEIIAQQMAPPTDKILNTATAFNLLDF
jgi:hypothetical protein